jgi:hypothetical protein
VSPLHGWIGAPLVLSCSSPRKDSSGWPACEDCGRRLSTCKGKLHKSGNGKICQSCYDKHRGKVATAAPVAPLIRLPSPQPTAAMDIAPPPSPISKLLHTQTVLPPLLLHDSPTYYSYLWSLHRSSRQSNVLSTGWGELIKSGELKAWEEKRGKFWQMDAEKELECSHMDQLRVSLVGGSEAFGRQVLRAHSIDASQLQRGDMKLLRCSHKQGLQEIHCDVPEPTLAQQCYTVLVYLTATLSTAVPRQQHSAARHAACYVADASTVRSRLLKRSDFSSCWVNPGDAMLLRGDCPHFGVANPNKELRYVLFLSFSPKKQPLPDTEEQRYPQGVHN